ncbi:MAG: hypothetical protein AB8F94_05390 [Saprospiraceae bacterium]
MKNIPIKLNHLVEEFHYFEDNQVLTASHLNTVVDFLDRRDRMTRTKLIGTGIVCGLEVGFNNSNKTITISKGSAITSDGDLLHIDQNTTFSHVKIFEDEKAKYELFQNGSSQVPLYQLFTAESPEENIHSMRGRNNPIQNLGEMVLVLYLNSFLEAPEDCTEVDCENQGMRQRAKLMPLLVAKNDLDLINQKPANPYFTLPEVNIQRVNFHQSVITHEENLLARFRTAVQVSSPSLVTAVLATCGNRQGDFLRNLVTGIYPNPSSVWNSRLNAIFQNININDRADVLYIYNFMKDLKEAYDEFKESIFELWTECCPDATSHPKHINVQEILVENENIPAEYRHHFCESPILNQRDRNVKKAQFLHQRMNEIIEHFEVPNNQNADIRITPSKSGNVLLGEKSIPYYYNAQNFNLHRFWSYKKTIRNQFNSIFSYRARQYDGSAVAQNPLAFSHDKLDFLRIEGHLGKSKDEVEKQLETLKKLHNLQFNIVAVQIQDEVRTIRLPKLRFPAVDMLFHHYREEFNSNTKIVDKFHTDLRATSAIAVADKNTPEDLMRENLERSKIEINSMKDEMEAAKTQVKTKMASFDLNYKSFKTNYQKAAVKGDLIHKNVFEYTQTKYETPMQKFVLDYKFNRFDGLVKYFRKKKEKVQQQYIFDNFFNQNPGLESKGGVPIGGTFVLVYISDDDESQQRIVADFCLPSCCAVEIDPEIEPTEIPEEEIEKPTIVEVLPDIKFIEKIDLFKFSPIKTIVDYKVDFTAVNLVGQINEIRLLNTGNLGVGNASGNLGLVAEIQDPNIRGLVRAMDTTAEGIRTLEAKDTRTPDEEAKLGLLRENFDNSSESILKFVGAKGTDLDVSSDESRALEFIGRSTESFKEKDKFIKTGLKTKELESSNPNNPVIRGMVGKIITRMK